MINMIKALIILLVLTTPGSLWSQQLRGVVAGELRLPTTGGKTGTVVSFSIEDFVGILADDDLSQLEGIELKVEIPRGISQYRNSFAIYIYKNVSPVPSATINTYRGVQIYMRILPVLDTCFVIIPFIDNSDYRQDATTLVLPKAVIHDEFPLLFSIQPVAKALPSGIYEHKFRISAKPLFAQSGFLTLTGALDGQDPLRDLFIDGTPWTGPLTAIPLKVGVHSLVMISSKGEKEVQNIVIEQGKTTFLKYAIKATAPAYVTFEIPEGMDLFIDGKPVIFDNGQKQVSLPPGLHLITYISGDYKYSKSVDFNPGDKIRIRLHVDMMIEKY